MSSTPTRYRLFTRSLQKTQQTFLNQPSQKIAGVCDLSSRKFLKKFKISIPRTGLRCAFTPYHGISYIPTLRPRLVPAGGPVQRVLLQLLGLHYRESSLDSLERHFHTLRWGTMTVTPNPPTRKKMNLFFILKKIQQKFFNKTLGYCESSQVLSFSEIKTLCIFDW